MNLLKKYFNILCLILLSFFIVSDGYTEVLTGTIRKEIKQEGQYSVEIPTKEPEYSTGAILAYNKGIEEYKFDNYDKALAAFHLAVKQEPTFADAYFNLGILYDYFSNTKKALVAFNRAYSINKKDEEALYYVIKCYVNLNDYVAGKYYFKKLSPDSEYYQKAKNLFNEE